MAVTKEKNEPGVAVYPNPSDNSFNVTIKRRSGNFTFTAAIYNVGQIVEELNMPAGTNTISIGEHLSPGIYFLRIKSSTGQKGIKLIKE